MPALSPGGGRRPTVRATGDMFIPVPDALLEFLREVAVMASRCMAVAQGAPHRGWKLLHLSRFWLW